MKAGGALIDNMAWLFVIGVGVGMADDHDRIFKPKDADNHSQRR